MGTMGSLVRELGLLLFLHCVVGGTSRSNMVSSNTGPDVNNIDQLVKMNNTEITAVTPRGPTMSERISNPFRSTVLEENSGITKPPEIETVIIEEIIPFTLLAEFTDIASNTIEREETPIENTTLAGTLTTISPITEATMLTSNSIDNFSTIDNTQEIETTTAVTLSMAFTNPEEENIRLETSTSAEMLGVVGNNSQSKIITEETTLTGDIIETIGTRAKTTILPGTSVTINDSSEEETSTLLNTILFSETSVSSSSAEEESSASVETLTTTNLITMAVSTTGEISNAGHITGHIVEATDNMTTNTLNTISIPTTEEITAVFTEVPTVMYSTEERSTNTRFTTTAEFSDKVYTTTEGTTPGNDGGFLLLRLVVYSSLDLTDFKVAKELLNKLHQDLWKQVPYTQISLMRVTKG